MAKEYVPIFFDWLENTQDIAPEDKGNLIDAVVAYAAGEDYEKFLTPGNVVAFRFMKGQIDRNNKISDSRSIAGSSKKDQNTTNENKPEQNETNGIKTEQTESNFPKEKEKEKEKDKENKKESKKEKMETAERFSRFWHEYPRKESKVAAQRAFEKLKPDEELLQTMIAAIHRQKDSAQWQENGGQYIPHPSSWLNNHRWEDETRTAQGKTVTAQQYEQRDYNSVQDDIMRDFDRAMDSWQNGGVA